MKYKFERLEEKIKSNMVNKNMSVDEYFDYFKREFIDAIFENNLGPNHIVDFMLNFDEDDKWGSIVRMVIFMKILSEIVGHK